ncbi:hypothetical protein E05_05080 [Plautia stali symbiont]|nr:hypothetical protein E05_05080 [Plautia stali symbiont]
MTEFAFSGLGINPHYGTPANPWQRGEKRIPGGSSSGAVRADRLQTQRQPHQSGRHATAIGGTRQYWRNCP